MEEYAKVLDEQPSNTRVADRMVDYYVQLGSSYMEENDLNNAEDAFLRAVNVSPTSTTARERLQEAQQAIATREEQLGGARGAVEAALSLEKRAEELAQNDNIGEAMDALLRARSLYQGVTPEFPEQRRLADSGLTAVNQRLNQLRASLIVNAQSLSGAAAAADAQALARRASPEIAEESLRAITAIQYKNRLAAITESLEEEEPAE
jgi:tetratricopeptide (TPR) repeat protein